MCKFALYLVLLVGAFALTDDGLSHDGDAEEEFFFGGGFHILRYRACNGKHRPRPESRVCRRKSV